MVERPPGRLHEDWFQTIARMPHRGVEVDSSAGEVSLQVLFSPFPFGPGQFARCGIGLPLSPLDARHLAAALLREAELADGLGSHVAVTVFSNSTGQKND